MRPISPGGQRFRAACPSASPKWCATPSGKSRRPETPGGRASMRGLAGSTVTARRWRGSCARSSAATTGGGVNHSGRSRPSLSRRTRPQRPRLRQAATPPSPHPATKHPTIEIDHASIHPLEPGRPQARQGPEGAAADRASRTGGKDLGDPAGGTAVRGTLLRAVGRRYRLRHADHDRVHGDAVERGDRAATGVPPRPDAGHCVEALRAGWAVLPWPSQGRIDPHCGSPALPRRTPHPVSGCRHRPHLHLPKP
jgi:hypothetical protein